MESLIQYNYEHLQSLHIEIKHLLEGLPQEALDWTPGKGMNSLCVIAFHVSGSERFWVGDIVAGESSGRDREAEFRAKGLDAGILEERLRSSLEYCRNVFERLTLQDMQRLVTSPRDGREYTVGWALSNVVEHTATHVGHMQLTRQLWEQR